MKFRLIDVVVLIRFVGCLVASTATDDLLAETQPTASEPRCPLIEWIDGFSKENGAPPTDRDFAAQAVASHTEASDLAKSWQHLIRSQHPIVTKSDLIDLVRAKIASIHDFRCKYIFEARRLENDVMTLTRREENSFRRSGSMLRIHCSRLNATASAPVVSEYCYNGNFVESVRWPIKSPNASIGELHGRADYFRYFDILASVMLVDSDVDLGMGTATCYDLIKLLEVDYAIILQSPEVFEGRSCLVVSNAMFRVFLDVERGLSVVGVESQAIECKSSEGNRSITTSYPMTYVRRLESLTDYGNGIWLPQKVEAIHFANGRKVSREVTEVIEMAVNKGIADSEFSNIIPEGAFVSDGIRKASYVYGDNASIQGAISDAINGVSRRTQRVQLGLVIANLLVFAGLFGWLWRRRYATK